MQNMDEIYRKYARNVYQYLISITHDADISEEVTQETFYQAIKSINRYDGSCKVTTWLCAIAKNQLIVYRRKHPETEPLEKESDDGSLTSIVDQEVSSAEEEMLAISGRVEIMKLLHTLNEPYREILYLRTFGNLSFKEIGEVFGKTENWARVSFYRGKEQLKKEIEKKDF